ncbi:PP2C family protein-serine/threonine phosphatase [Roseovarius sp. THAF27]|uniref:PP2C family protein-serine/threonine phosphatase n=1 Tax=Roseovarius sp. THAF27 TaxID=2587850 RepID=UPI001268503D|nr:fused response regulator/phosphatase [Roseovarius sp. THAF27]
MSIRRVLVVDDSRLQRRIINAALSRLGLEVVEAGSGTEALAICEAAPPDLVISDWMMPGMNGLELCRAFRALPREDYGYFILVTSKSEKEEVALGLDAGADDFLTKPINPGELRARIAAGDRIVRMQRELSETNRLVRETLAELQGLYDSLDSDLIEAKKLQQSLISERYREFGSAQVSLLLRSAAHVGGDLVGVFPVSETRIGLYAIDVSGHGVSSALMTARLAGYLSATTPEQNVALVHGPDGFLPRPPNEVLADLNQMFLGEIETELYFTMLLADVDLATGRVTMAQAGHPCPAIQRADGRVEINGPGGLPVGLIDGATYDAFEVQLYPGDRLLLHSDGVDECADRAGRLLGEDGVRRILRELRQTEGMALLESVIWKLAEYAGRDDFDDDVSAVLLEFRPVGKAP